MERLGDESVAILVSLGVGEILAQLLEARGVGRPRLRIGNRRHRLAGRGGGAAGRLGGSPGGTGQRRKCVRARHAADLPRATGRVRFSEALARTVIPARGDSGLAAGRAGRAPRWKPVHGASGAGVTLQMELGSVRWQW